MYVSTRDLVSRGVFLGLFGIFTFSAGELHGQSRHAGLPPPPPPVKVAETDAGSSCTGVACAAHGAPQFPTYDAITFIEQQGAQFELGYDRLCALAVSAPHTTIVAQYNEYDVIIRRRNLGPVFDALRRRQIGTLQATSIANGSTLSIPLVPLASLPRSNVGAYENRAWGDSVPPLPPPDDPTEEDEPVITEVRIALSSPFSFGKSGEYVREED